MKIAISAVGINHRAGTGRHMSQLLRHLASIDSVNEYLVFLSPDQMADLKDMTSPQNFRFYNVARKLQGVIFGTIWNFTFLSRKIREEGVDLIHFLEMNRCFIPRFCPVIVTVHGLIALQVENKDGRLRGFYHKRIEPIALRRADHIIAVSNNTKRDIIQLIGIPDNRISTIPNGGTIWPKGEANLHFSQNRKLRNVRKPYLLFVSRIEHPNKNHLTLLHAFKQFLLKSKKQVQLVLVGEKGWRFEVVKEAIDNLGLNEHVILTGFVTDIELKTIYQGARGFVMPSLYEGFGIPIIEAMAMHVPVACSNTSSLKEIAQDAAIYFSPNREDEITEALNAVVWDENIRKMLIEKGLKRAADYCWSNIANTTLKLYETILHSSLED